jgi:hypothetical protein
MKLTLHMVVLGALLVCSVSAQQKSPDASAAGNLMPTRPEVEKFMEVMQLRQRMQGMRQAQQEETKRLSHDMFAKSLPEATTKQKAEYEKIVADEFSTMFADYPIEDALRDVVPIYQSHFTESDLQKITAFYSSPVGQKVLKEMPGMMTEAARVSYSRIQPKIQTMMKDVQTRIQAIANEGENK